MSAGQPLPADPAAIEKTVLAAWRDGKNTHEIAREILGGPVHCAGLEARVSRIIAAEQNRQYAERLAARSAGASA